MKIFYIVILVLLIASCSEKQETHSKLLSFNKEFIMENGIETEPYFKDKKSFLKAYLNIASNGDTLFVSTVKNINTCANFIGNITIDNDSIRLITTLIGGETCTSESLYKCDYKILVEKGKNYKIFDDNLLLGTSHEKIIASF